MNLNERENNRQDDQYFQEDETRYDNERQYDDIDIDAPPADHSISDNAEPDFGNDFAEDEINSQRLDDEIPSSDDFDNEFDDEEDDDLEEDDFDEEDLDDDDEEGTDPNRNL